MGFAATALSTAAPSAVPPRATAKDKAGRDLLTYCPATSPLATSTGGRSDAFARRRICRSWAPFQPSDPAQNRGVTNLTWFGITSNEPFMDELKARHATFNRRLAARVGSRAAVCKRPHASSMPTLRRLPRSDPCPSRWWQDNRRCAWRRGGHGTSLLRSSCSVCSAVLLLGLGRANLERLSLGSIARAGLRITLLRPVARCIVPAKGNFDSGLRLQFSSLSPASSSHSGHRTEIHQCG